VGGAARALAHVASSSLGSVTAQPAGVASSDSATDGDVEGGSPFYRLSEEGEHVPMETLGGGGGSTPNTNTNGGL